MNGGMIRGTLAMIGAFACAGALPCAGADSQPIPITVRPESSVLWRTVASWPLTVALDAPSGAASASVSVTTPSGTVSYPVADLSAGSFQVPGTCPATDAEECVIDLSVAYLDADGKEIPESGRSVRLGVVRSVGGGVGTLLTREVGSRAWNGASGRPVCLAPVGATRLTWNSEDVSPFSAPGWWLMPELAEGEAATATLYFGETPVEAELFGKGIGFLLLLR